MIEYFNGWTLYRVVLVDRHTGAIEYVRPGEIALRALGPLALAGLVAYHVPAGMAGDEVVWSAGIGFHAKNGVRINAAPLA
jgi:hypothetical protein